MRATDCTNVFKLKIVLMLISFIPISGKGEKGALKEWDKAPNKSNNPTAFQASKIPHIKAEGFFHIIYARNNAVIPIAKSPRKAIVQSGGAARGLSKIPRERKSPEPTPLNTIHPVAKIKNFIEVDILSLLYSKIFN
jgi:hypothetical protein